MPRDYDWEFGTRGESKGEKGRVYMRAFSPLDLRFDLCYHSDLKIIDILEGSISSFHPPSLHFPYQITIV